MTENVNERRVSLFRNGRNQALRIPREFELDGQEAIVWKDGDRLIVDSHGRSGRRAVGSGSRQHRRHGGKIVLWRRG